MRFMVLCFSLTASVIAAAGAYSPDLDRGKALLENNCLICHDTRAFTRPNRIVHSIDQLKFQVYRWTWQTGLRWFPEDVADIVHYLNSTYYKFECSTEPC
jgi:mono/diheme cytochrome c family protein